MSFYTEYTEILAAAEEITRKINENVDEIIMLGDHRMRLRQALKDFDEQRICPICHVPLAKHQKKYCGRKCAGAARNQAGIERRANK